MLVPGTTKPYEVGKLMIRVAWSWTYKADVQNENPWPQKIFHARNLTHMGLDTHDYGILTEPMQANMVFTVEPGIYIPAEGFESVLKMT
jgi:Xaa-Pro aminopeptidase